MPASYAHSPDHELDDYLELLLTQEDPKDKVIVTSRVLPHRIKRLKRHRVAPSRSTAPPRPCPTAPPS
ncbi:hypothetical protein [Streptomyces sp. NPDC004296]|uniref:hypothetical protein n=1 Tax=Streptomyces sp. NPDC004296 TaxID=3364697 RepID=UPI0036AA4811